MQRILIILTSILVIIISYSASVIWGIHSKNMNEYGSIILRDAQGRIITKKGLPGGYMLEYTGSLSGKLFDAIIDIEDRRFYAHHGVDLYGKIGAIKENISAGSVVRGGSTITEQYIKNAFYRGKKRTIKQKIDEAIAALWIEKTETKEEILRKYLNNIYFGNNTYGIRGALERYFGEKNISELTEDDILDIITRIHSPNIKTSDEARDYRNQSAKKLGWNTGTSSIDSKVQTHYRDLYPLVTLQVLNSIKKYCEGDDASIKKWTKTIDATLCKNGQIDLTLTLNGGLQDYTESLVRQTISKIQNENVTAGAVYVYNPTNRSILAYIGNSGLSRAEESIDMIQRRRSVGSLLKPFIYLLALREGAELENLVLDENRTYPTGVDGKVFIPQNYNPISYGPVRLREALGNSLNSSAVRISEAIGIGKIYNFLLDMGLDLDHDAGYYGYGISLGTVELSLENIVESYTYMTQTDDSDIFLIQEALRDERNRAKTFGLSSILGTSIRLPVKTGTSTDFRDNWTLSYHRDGIIGVWIGNANGSAMQDVSGVSGAGPIWHSIAEYMISQDLLKNISSQIPEGIVETYNCLDTKCIQKERVLMKTQEPIRTRMKDNLFFKEDFFGEITEGEKIQWNIKE